MLRLISIKSLIRAHVMQSGCGNVYVCVLVNTQNRTMELLLLRICCRRHFYLCKMICEKESLSAWFNPAFLNSKQLSSQARDAATSNVTFKLNLERKQNNACNYPKTERIQESSCVRLLLHLTGPTLHPPIVLVLVEHSCINSFIMRTRDIKPRE